MNQKLSVQWRERLKLKAEGAKLWAEAIIEAYGNIKFEWKLRGDFLDCTLGNGEVYHGDEPIDNDMGNYQVRVGGLLRCCIETLERYMNHQDREPEESGAIMCDIFGHMMIFRRGAWEWDNTK
jgi:hypothetical protein